jgi:hypothetical protein
VVEARHERGVSLDTLFERAEPRDAYAVAYSHGGYTTNLAIADLTDGTASASRDESARMAPSTRRQRRRLSEPSSADLAGLR